MNINDIIQSALSLSEKYKTSTQTERLRSLAEAIKQDKLKVVVLGDFKAGKSTLLNRLFIHKDMLPTDHLEATAVPTHLSNGSMGMNTWMRGIDGKDMLVNERSLFTDADVAASVTAPTEEERASKAEQYSRVCITMPGILPDNITLVDTPGLNTPNTAIYTGTLAEARTADAILYVVRARQLNAREKALITDLAGSQMLKVPVHVVLTHDTAANISQAQLQNICQSIQDQLKSCKVNCGVSIFRLDDDTAGSGSIAERINTSFDDFSFTTAPAEPVAEAGDIESELLAFFNGDVRRGREARIARDLKPGLASLKAAVQARLSLADTNEEQIKKIELQKQNIEKEYIRVIKSLLMDVRTAQLSFCEHVMKDLDTLRDEHIQHLHTLTMTGDILAAISDWHQDMPVQLERKLAKRKQSFEQDMSDICRKHGQEDGKSFTCEKFATEMPSDWLTKFVTFVPNWALVITDFLIFEFLSPLPPIIDLPLRMLAEKIDFLKKIMPADLAGAAARQFAIIKLTEYVRNIKRDVQSKLDNQFDELNKKLEQMMCGADLFAEQNAAIAEFRNGTLSPAQKQQLVADMEQISQWGLNI